MTSGALWWWTAGSSHRGVEVAVLTVANLGVTVMRFVAMRAWMFVRRPSVEPVVPSLNPCTRRGVDGVWAG